jgi:hypothetical protein
MKMTVEIENISKAEKIALEDLLATWASLGKNDRVYLWTAFLAGGKFRPEIKVDGHIPRNCDLPDRIRAMYWVENSDFGDTYRIDSAVVTRLLRNGSHE